jgi:DNA polymerase-3 subunit alpha
MEGLYSKWPRIDKELILKYHKGSSPLPAVLVHRCRKLSLKKARLLPKKNLNGGSIFLAKTIYIELQRHDIPEQEIR